MTDMLILEGGTLIDGRGGDPLPNASVVIENDRIARIGTVGELDLPPGARHIDTTDKTVIPGLIDAHVHDCGDWAVRSYLHYGITTIKDAGTMIDQTLEQKRQIESGEKLGPRLFVNGPIIDGAPVSYPALSLELNDADDAYDKVRQLIEEKDVDGVLVAQRVDAPMLQAVVEVAHAHGRLVSGQTWLLSGREASRIGIDALENTSRMPEMSETDDPAFNRFDEPLDIGERIKRLAHMWTHTDENKMGKLIELMVQQGVFWVPTLVMFRQLGGIYDQSIRQSESLGSVPEGYLQRWQHDERYATWGEDEYRALQAALAAIQTFTRRFHEAGGAVIAGTDNPNPYTVPGPSLHQELELLVEAGLSPMQALQSATSRAARFLGRRASDIGEIAPGKVADCVVVDGDPLADIRHTRQIAMVIKGGQIIDHDHLIQA